jgi:hypothetical protein
MQRAEDNYVGTTGTTGVPVETGTGLGGHHHGHHHGLTGTQPVASDMGTGTYQSGVPVEGQQYTQGVGSGMGGGQFAGQGMTSGTTTGPGMGMGTGMGMGNTGTGLATGTGSGRPMGEEGHYEKHHHKDDYDEGGSYKTVPQ